MNSIKNALKISAILFVLAFMLTLGSCEMFINWFGTSIEDRVEAFNDDLSAGKYSVLYKHFHSDTVDRYDMKNDPTNYWDPTPIYPNGNINNYSVSGDTVTGTVDTNGDPNQPFTMEMKKDGMDYYIRKLNFDGWGGEIKKLD